MKFNFFMAILAILVFSSCGGGSKGTTNKEEQQQAQNNVVRANQIIAYTNKVIEESNHMNSWAEGNERYVKNLAEFAVNPKLVKNPMNLTFFISNVMFFNYETRSSVNNQPIDLNIVPDGVFDADDKEFFESSASAYYESKNGLKSFYDKVKVYIDEENFKDDKGALGKAYYDSVKSCYMNMLVTISEMTELAIELGQEAELLTLEDSPLKSVILLMREQMKYSNNMLAAFEAFKAGEASKEEVLQMYEEYILVTDKNVEKVKDLKLTDTQKRRFNTFMENSDTVRSKFKVAERNVRNGEKIESVTLSTAEIYVSSLVRHYNDVIQ